MNGLTDDLRQMRKAGGGILLSHTMVCSLLDQIERGAPDHNHDDTEQNKVSAVIEQVFKDALVTEDLDNPKFENKINVMDWRNYVDERIVKIWSMLTLRERQLIALFCERAANNEEWD